MTLDDPHPGLAGIAETARSVRAGRVSALALLEARLEHFEERDRGLNCFTEIMAGRARREAEAVDATVAAGRDPGPLAGVLFGVKDNYDVAGRVTVAGSIVNRRLPPAPCDAVLMQRLNRAGGVLIGTQNMDELAYGFTTENAHYGPTRNPLDPGAQCRRLVGRLGGGGRRGAVRRIVRLRHQRLDPGTSRVLRTVRAQADVRPAAAHRHLPVRPRSRSPRPACAQHR